MSSSSCVSSSTPYHHRTLMLIPLLLFLLTTPSQSQPHNAMLHDSCHPISAHLPPPLRFHLQRLHRCPPPPPPPPRDEGDEIDPRYGVEKRLVPSGPNPLHN
ncbi:CLAVATA3/ESR (CLE)-related protein 10 [Sesamum alatum]|uniref:CLAVATA3/ESR (CLE)-related protein 10 n=1 Tax=Sesamum alatum TaxID=300844 RepID=A0AAE1YGU8_9LAMI|nr:CLAVATA3/ESR (CLE)-related protein 10 [Sesamum alatum]